MHEGEEVKTQHKEITDERGRKVTGVRYTEYRLAGCFDPGEDGFHVLQLLAHQQLTVYGAAKLLQKILKGHRITLSTVDYTKRLAPYIDHEQRMKESGNDGDASELE